jgi:hypothetical protein
VSLRKSTMSGYKHMMRFLDSLTVELSRRSVTGTLLLCKGRDTRKRSALVNF